jgi:hypothetical protein
MRSRTRTSVRGLLVAITAVLLAPAAALPSLCAQEPQRGGGEDAARVLCDECGHDGVLECNRHRGDELELEQQVEFCSEAIACRKCEGALAVDCKACSNEAAESALAERRRLAQEWLAARRERIEPHLDESVKRDARHPIIHLRTRHMDLVCTLAPLKVGKKTYDAHRLAHLYAQRIESLVDDFCSVLEIDPVRGFPLLGTRGERMEVCLLEERDDYRSLVPHMTAVGGREATSVKEMGQRLVYLVWHDARLLRDDEALTRQVVHNATHLLVSAAHPVQWIGNRGHGWLDEGVAHWFEDRVGDACSTFCFEEIGYRPGDNYERGRWRVGVRKLLESGELTPFVDVYGKKSDELTLHEHAQVFAYVDFVLAQESGGRKLRAILERAKAGETMRDVLPEVLGFGVLQFDEKFRAFVQETYPIRER